MKQIETCIRNISKELETLADVLKETTNKEAGNNNETKAKVTHEELRTLLSGLTANGLTEAVSSLLKKYGTGKLSSVPETKYDTLYKEAIALTKEGGDNA